MKRIFLLFIGIIFLSTIASAQISSDCNLEATLISQDPYPAIPGEYVKIVFQLDGVNNPECGEINFELEENFPITFDPGTNPIVTVQSGIYAENFRSFLIIPYRVRVDADALDDENPIDVVFSSERSVTIKKEFNLTVEDLRTDFEVSIKDYLPETNTLTFEILNIGEHDVEALTVEIPKQDSIAVKGSSRNIVGGLDSNEDTTFSFEAIPQKGGIDLKIFYTDEINERRSLEKTVGYDPVYFTDRARDQTSRSPIFYIVIVVIILILFFWYRRRQRKKKRKG